MLKVDIIYKNSIYAPNGASMLVKMLVSTHNIFTKYGVEQRIISPSEPRCSVVDNNDIVPIAKKSPFKKFLRRLSRFSLILAWLRYYRVFVMPAEHIIDKYDLLREKGDVVVFHEVETCYAYLKRYKNSGKKVVLVIHGGGGKLWESLYLETPRFKSALLKPYKKKVEKMVFDGCSRIGFDADLPRKKFCSSYPIAKPGSFYAYNGIEKRPFVDRNNFDKLRIICVATLSVRKNQSGILDAIGVLSKEYQHKIELILVGDGPEKKTLEDKAAHLDANVDFTGVLNESQYYNYMLKSNCFCLFSKEEGLPIAVVEALRAGLPVIGSRVGGIPEEVIEGETGFIVDLNIEELSQKLKWMVDNLDKLYKMGKASYQLFVEKFTTEAMVKQYVDVYKS